MIRYALVQWILNSSNLFNSSLCFILPTSSLAWLIKATFFFFLQDRKCLNFLCLRKMWAKNYFYMHYNDKYCHIKGHIRETWLPSYCWTLSATSEFYISKSPHVKTFGSYLYCNSSVSPTFLWLFSVRVKLIFWTMAECTWPHAKRKVNCLSLNPEWKSGCIVLRVQKSFNVFLQCFNCFILWNVLFVFFKYIL